MSLLARMAGSSAARARAARSREGESALLARALDTAEPARLALHPAGFDLFAEIKHRAPSAGRLLRARTDADVSRRALAYASAGAAAVSVVTEPEEFAGSLEDLAEAARAVRVPILRKDFLVDPYQVLEARAAGAAGCLLVLRMLDEARLQEMLDAAARVHLFVLLEAFDAEDLARAGQAVRAASRRGVRTLVGLNARDLSTLEVDPERFGSLRADFPQGAPRVAESGLGSAMDVRDVAALGYRIALVGGALMRADDPRALAGAMIAAGREAVVKPCTSE